MNSNPIYIEHYAHGGGRWYKINNPWTKFAKETIVLCPVEEGFERALTLARQVIMIKFEAALQSSLQT